MARFKNTPQNSLLRLVRRLAKRFFHKITRPPYPAERRPRIRIRLKDEI